MNERQFFNLGAKIAATAFNKSAADLTLIDGFVSGLDDTSNPNYGTLQQMVCKIASDAFDEAGRKDEPLYHVYDGLTKASTWFKEFDIFSDAALRAMGKLAFETHNLNDTQVKDDVVKQARNLLPNLINIAGSTTPELVKATAGAGVIGGGLLGGLYWLLNRHSNEDENKAEAIKAKINYYNKLSDEIKKQLQQNPDASSSEVKEMVENSLF